jgi:predicted SAM-dependent methyltransferase
MRQLVKRLKGTSAYVAYRENTKAAQRWLALPRYLGRTHACPVCGTGLRRFKPIWKSYVRKLREHGFVHPIDALETFNVTAHTCPACGASDRERLYALYLEDRFRTLDQTRRYTLVDFAASPGLARRLRARRWLAYRTADLYRPGVDDRVDIANMAAYGDASIDMFICSHILEHVPDDRRAMRELFRVLKPGGFGIVMVPLVVGVEDTHEDPSIADPAGRWKHYAQDDHLRLYGRRDLVRRLEEAGFKVLQLRIDDFGRERFRRAGIHENSTLYVVEKPEPSRGSASPPNRTPSPQAKNSPSV